MLTIKWVVASIGSLVLLLALSFALGLFGLEWKKFFGVKHANVDRKIFEQSKSFVHGKTQDLAKYYREYQLAGPKEKELLKAVIRMQFAEFDEKHLMVPALRQFLIDVRGY